MRGILAKIALNGVLQFAFGIAAIDIFNRRSYSRQGLARMAISGPVDSEVIPGDPLTPFRVADNTRRDYLESAAVSVIAIYQQ